jgi:hypothetical protein
MAKSFQVVLMHATAKTKIAMAKLTTGLGKFLAGWAFVKLRSVRA